MSIAIVTDSTSDLPPHIRQKYTIFQVPAALIIEGQTFKDGVDISRDDFYRNLPTYEALPTTASPPSGAFHDAYQRIFSKGYGEILSIHVASKLSGTLNAAHVAARNFKSNVRIIDSGQVSLGLGFQVIEAAKAAANAVPIQKIVDHIHAFQERIFVFAILDTLHYALQSGRIPWITASLGSFLNLKPIIRLKYGKVTSAGFSRARRKAINHLREKIGSRGALEYLGILHSNAKEEAEAIRALHQRASLHEPLIVNVTTSIGTHIGPKGLGFVAVVK